jgi:hypothetical protein
MITSSPLWNRAVPPGPDVRVKITKEYAKHVARDAFFWAWPLVNVYNKRLARSGFIPDRRPRHRLLARLFQRQASR